MKLKKSQYKYIIVLVILVIISLIIYKLNNKKEKETIISNKTQIVTNYSKFFTVDSSINKLVVFLETKDTDSILKVLDDEYKKTNNINTNNVYDFFPKLNDNIYAFVSKEMYVQNKNNNIEKYYVKGTLNKEEMDENSVFIGEYYFIIKLDTDKRVFSLIPIDKEEYEGVINE